MTAAVPPFRVDTISRVSGDTATPYVHRRYLLAGVQPYQFYMVQGVPSSGLLCGVIATATPGLMMLGAADRDTVAPGAADGAADVNLYQQWLIGYYQTTNAGDVFSDADFGTVAWCVDNQTIGKLSNFAGVNRSPAGIFLGLDREQGKAVIGIGPIYSLLARSLHTVDNSSIAFRTTADGAASTTTAETGTSRAPHHFQVLGAQVAFDAAVTGSDSVYATITVYARDVNGANQRVIATGATGATSATTNWMGGTSTAFKYQSMTLTATAASLFLLETDVITYAVTKASTGTQLSAASVRLLGKVN